MRREAKLIGWFAVVIGGASLLIGVLSLTGNNVQAKGLSCKAICGLSMLIAEIFGELAGRVTAGFITIAIGICAILLGYLILKD
jgi:hypothetical protein